MNQLVSPISIAVVAALALVGSGLLVLGNTRRGRQAGPPADYPGLVRLNRWTLPAPYFALSVGLIGLLPLLIWPNIWRWIYWGMLPSILGSAVLIGVIVAEAVRFKAAQTPGVASLERRGLTTYVPWPLIAVIAVVIGGTGTFMGWVTHLTNGGQNTITLLSKSGNITVVMGGGFAMTGALLARLLFVTVLAVVAVAVIARRPRNGADPILSHWDNVLRRRSLRVTLTTLVGVAAASLAIWSADVLSGAHQVFACSEATGQVSPSANDVWGISFNNTYAPPFGASVWPLQDNYYNTLLAVAVAAVLLALIAGAMIAIRPVEAAEVVQP